MIVGGVVLGGMTMLLIVLIAVAAGGKKKKRRATGFRTTNPIQVQQPSKPSMPNHEIYNMDLKAEQADAEAKFGKSDLAKARDAARRSHKSGN